MKTVLISIHPKWVEKIASGEKTVEVRKTKPKIDTPFKCYIYETESKDNETYKRYKVERLSSGKVIGEFICDEIIEWQYDKGHQYYVDYPDDCTSYFPYLKCHSEATGLKCSEIEKLGKGKPLYGLHISDLKIYGKPKELSEFGLTRLPQSWQYVDEVRNGNNDRLSK